MVDLNITLPERFLETETRCDHKVTVETKKIWAVESDLLQKLMAVCDRNSLRYFADGGTLLGAIRHNGFIPWDDDIDIAMPREDYDKLCSIAASEFDSPYFFQTVKSDPECTFHHAKLRNSDTTGMVVTQQDRHYNQGIWIDIFPLDNLPDSQDELNSFTERLSSLQSNLADFRAYVSEYHSKKGKGFIKFVKHMLKHWIFATKYSFSKDSSILYSRIDEELSRYKSFPTHRVSNLSIIWLAIPKQLYYPREWFQGEARYAQFEFLKIPVPPMAENVLETIYGNWHLFVKGAACHSSVIFDTDKPYKLYFKRR